MVSEPDGPAHWVYWSGLVSTAHLLYGTAWLRRLRETAPRPITVVLAGFHSFLGVRQLDHTAVAQALAGLGDVRVAAPGDGDLRIPAGYSGHYLAVGAPGIKAWLRLRRANPTRRIETIVTDEGLSSYGTWRTRRDAWRREGGREPWPTVRALAVAAARRGLTTRRWAMYRATDAHWQVNPWIRGEFLAAGTRQRVRPTAVFCSQPWVQLGLLSAAEYTAFVLAVAESCRAQGLDFILRPHPVEDTSPYHARIQVSSETRPAESDPECINATVLLGASSTALLNLAAVHGVPVVRVSPPAVAALDAHLSPDQASLLRGFLGEAVEPGELPAALGRLA